MFPVALDLTSIPVLLAGYGELTLKRLAYLDEAHAAKVKVFCDKPSHALREAAGDRLVERMPVQQDIVDFTVVMLAGLSREVAQTMVGWVRSAGKLVNVEDVNDLCDFYFTANVRRGDLLIAVSTGGASPTLARRVRDAIGLRFGEEWAERTQDLAKARLSWRAEGKGMKEVMNATDEILAREGWLS